MHRFDDLVEDLVNSPLPLEEKLDYHMRLVMGKHFSPTWLEIATGLMTLARRGESMDFQIPFPKHACENLFHNPNPDLGFVLRFFKLDIYLSPITMARGASVKAGGVAQVEDWM